MQQKERLDSGDTKSVGICKVVSQGCRLSPTVFRLYGGWLVEEFRGWRMRSDSSIWGISI